MLGMTLALVVVAWASTAPTGPVGEETGKTAGGASAATGSNLPTAVEQPGVSASPSQSMPPVPPAIPIAGGGIGYPPAGPISVGTASAHGRVIKLTMAAPWKAGRAARANVAIYVPPGFDPSGRTRYPVIYEAPYGISTWTQPGRFSLPLALDSLIAERLAPREIVVLLGTSGGPYLDSECANSFDGRARIETWIVKTVVPWIDHHYPTVASRTGRAVMGASQGGYCAAALWSHHPDVFGAALIESGYFVSGVRSNQTVNASRPFGGNAPYERSQSPILRVATIPARLRASSLVLLEADPANGFYGKQVTAFMATLTRAGVPFRLYADPLGHSWPAFARDTPRMLVDLADWMALRGVVG